MTKILMRISYFTCAILCLTAESVLSSSKVTSALDSQPVKPRRLEDGTYDKNDDVETKTKPPPTSGGTPPKIVPTLPPSISNSSTAEISGGSSEGSGSEESSGESSGGSGSGGSSVESSGGSGGGNGGGGGTNSGDKRKESAESNLGSKVGVMVFASLTVAGAVAVIAAYAQPKSAFTRSAPTSLSNAILTPDTSHYANRYKIMKDGSIHTMIPRKISSLVAASLSELSMDGLSSDSSDASLPSHSYDGNRYRVMENGAIHIL